jgi:hypothetical protein
MAASRRYKKVSQTDEDELTAQNERKQEEESKKQTAERLEQISVKIHALFWVFAAIALGAYVDLVHVFSHHKVDR